MVEQQSTTLERDATSNLLLSQIDNAGRKTTYVYDAIGNVTSVTALAGTAQALTTTSTYEPNYNQLATYTDVLDHVTSLSYDTLGNLRINGVK